MKNQDKTLKCHDCGKNFILPYKLDNDQELLEMLRGLLYNINERPIEESMAELDHIKLHVLNSMSKGLDQVTMEANDFNEPRYCSECRVKRKTSRSHRR